MSLDLIAAVVCLAAGELAAENIVGYGLMSSGQQDNNPDSFAMLFNLQMVSVFFFGLFLGIVVPHWRLLGAVATAACLHGSCSILSCFRRRRINGIGKGDGKEFGRDITTCSKSAVVFHIENLDVVGVVGPSTVSGKSKGDYKGKHVFDGGPGNAHVVSDHDQFDVSLEYAVEATGHSTTPLESTSSVSSDSSHYVSAPVGYTGVLTILTHYGVDASDLSLNVLRGLRDTLVYTPPDMVFTR